MNTQTLHSVIEQMQQTIKAHDLFAGQPDPTAPLVLMVSGGSDSVALAYLVTSLYPAALANCTILHVNHLLRGKAAFEDEAFVRTLACELGLRCEVHQVDVAALAAERPGNDNVEQLGREVRYHLASVLLDRLCDETGVRRAKGLIATAHTLDDRAETFLMRSTVGAGLGGLRSIPFRNGRVIRPLLDCTRADLRTWLAAEGRTWREDETNTDTAYLRAYVRHEILARLRLRNPQVLQTLRRTMDILAEEDDYLATQAQALEAQYVSVAQAGPEYVESGIIPSLAKTKYVEFDINADCLKPKYVESGIIAGQTGENYVESGINPDQAEKKYIESGINAALLAEPLPLVRRVLHSVCNQVMPSNQRVTFEHIEAIATQGASPGFAITLPGGIQVKNEYGYLRFSAAEKIPINPSSPSYDQRIRQHTQTSYEHTDRPRIEPGVTRTNVIARPAPAGRGNPCFGFFECALINVTDLTDNPVAYAKAHATPTTIFVDADTLAGGMDNLQPQWGLSLSTFREGDLFCPLGMDGHHRLVSDLFIDRKIPVRLRSRIPILRVNNEIVWVVGIQQDDRYKVTEKTITMVAITYTGDSNIYLSA
ncbi:MAG: tRNA lysidine(34) synthetase TilS [Coriobacteriia bacterium]|nr:tRNA lysidine(34) synthetase TilS [Coriobacteriia bacterium]